MASSVQKNFRMSPRAIKLLHNVARARGMTETDVVQFCVSKFALAIGEDVERAKELLFEQICRAAANSPVLQSRIEESSSSALNEESGRGVRQASGFEAGQTAAAALAITAAESASRKHGPAKKK
jgi:hypothetical protein